MDTGAQYSQNKKPLSATSVSNILDAAQLSNEFVDPYGLLKDSSGRKEKKTKLKQAEEELHCHSDSKSIVNLIRRTIQNCDKKLLSSSTSLESMISNQKIAKSTESEFYKEMSVESEPVLVSLHKKNRIGELSHNAQKLADNINTQNLNHRLLNLQQKNFSVLSKSSDTRSTDTEISTLYQKYQELTVAELKQKMTALLLNTRAEEPKHRACNLNTRDRVRCESLSTYIKQNQKITEPSGDFKGKKLSSLASSLIPPLSVKPAAVSQVFDQTVARYAYNCNHLYTLLEHKAVITIQSYYRGYRVRKITSLLLCNKKSGRKLAANLSNWNSSKCYIIGKQAEKIPHAVLSKSEVCNTFKALPEPVRPVVALAETGNVGAFVNSYPARKIFFSTERRGSSKSQNKLNEGLTEGPLLHLSQTSFIEKETQTDGEHTMSLVLKPSKCKTSSYPRYKVTTNNHYKTSSSSVEVNWKKFDNSKKVLLNKNVNGNRTKSLPVKESAASYVDLKLFKSKTYSSNELAKVSLNVATESEYLKNEFCGSKWLSKDEISKYYPDDHLASNSCISERHSSVSELALESSLSDKNSMHFGSRISAELVYQNTLGCALDYLKDLENLHVMSQLEADSCSLNRKIKQYQAQIYALDTTLQKEKEQSNIYKKEAENLNYKLQDKDSELNLERLIQESQKRLMKMEQKYKSKTEAAVNEITKVPSQLDPEVITSATAAIVDATLSASEHNKHDSDQQLSEHSSVSKERLSIKRIESYSNDFTPCTSSNISKDESVKSAESAKLLSKKINWPNTTSDSTSLRSDTPSSSAYAVRNLSAESGSYSSNIVEDIGIHSISQKTSVSTETAETDKCKYEISPVIDTRATKVLESVNELSKVMNSFVSSVQVSSSDIKSDTAAHDAEGCAIKYPVNSELTPNTIADISSYSESFEPESGASDSSGPRLFQSEQTAKATQNENHQSANVDNQSGNDTSEQLVTVYQGLQRECKGAGALYSTLNLMETLQREEEIRFNHQRALLKMQEKSLIDEARSKLVSIHHEGGSHVRKKQRAVLLQLREQRSHIRRLIETQNLTAQYRKLIFLQHQHLLSSTTNVSGGIGYKLHSPRGLSPSALRKLDLNLSSSESHDTLSAFRSVGNSDTDSVSVDEEYKISIKESDQKLQEPRDGDTSNSDRGKEMTLKKEENVWNKKAPYPESPTSSVSKSPDRTEFSVYDTSFTEDDPTDIEDKISRKSKLLKEEEPAIFKVCYGSSSVTMEKETVWLESLMKESERNIGIVKAGTTVSAPGCSSISKEIQASSSKYSNENDARREGTEGIHNNSYSDSEMVECKRISNRATDFKSNKDRAVNKVPFSFKIPLSPRSQLKQHRRQSSESDDSFSVSQNETASDLSDGEGILVALREELSSRKAEVEKLHKEKRKLRRERLATQEQALRKQITIYDSYIQQTKTEIERESRELQNFAAVKPLIKKPQVAGVSTRKTKMQDQSVSTNSSSLSEPSLAEFTLSDQSSFGNKSSHLIILEQLYSSHSSNSKKSFTAEASHFNALFTEAHTASPLENSESGQLSSDRDAAFEISVVPEESVPEKKFDVKSESRPMPNSSVLSVSQEDEDLESLESEISVSEETDQSVSQVSSTETILQSPRKSTFLPPSDSAELEEKCLVKLEGKQQLDCQEKIDVTVLNQETSPYTADHEYPGRTDSCITDNKLEIFFPNNNNNNTDSTENDDTFMETSAEDNSIDSSRSSDSKDVVRQQDSFAVGEQVATDVCLQVSTVNLKEKYRLDVLQNCIEQENEKFEKKAETDKVVDEEVVDSILKSLVKETVHCMTVLYSNREKVNTEISGHIQEFGEVDLQSENLDELLIYDHTNKNISDIHLVPHSKSYEELYLHKIPSSSSAGVQIANSISPDSLSPDIVSPLKAAISAEKIVENNESPVQNLDESGNSVVDPVRETYYREPFLKDELTVHLKTVQASQHCPELTLEESPKYDEEFLISSSDGNWLEKDWWVSGKKFSSQLELREEEERLNAEIAWLEELQLFREQHPDLVIREVPNKPPPPYTPPKNAEEKECPVVSLISRVESSTPAVAKIILGENRPTELLSHPQPQSSLNTISVPHRLSKADLRKLATEIFNVVPTKEDDIVHVIQSAVDLLFEKWHNEEINPLCVEYSSNTEEINGDDGQSEDSSSLKESSRSFQRLLFDLTRELVSEICSLSNKPESPTWMKTSFPHLAEPLQVVRNCTKDSLLSFVMCKIRIIMGWEPVTKRETTLIKWARKKRDFVDQVLVHELQAEELSWTNYDEEEVEVKNELAQEIIDKMIEHDTKLFETIMKKKNQTEVTT